MLTTSALGEVEPDQLMTTATATEGSESGKIYHKVTIFANWKVTRAHICLNMGSSNTVHSFKVCVDSADANSKLVFTWASTSVSQKLSTS